MMLSSWGFRSVTDADLEQKLTKETTGKFLWQAQFMDHRSYPRLVAEFFPVLSGAPDDAE
jgi:hypothetical protein